MLYPASGDLMRAARHQAGYSVVEHGLYWYRAHTSAEAAYLTALLNAPCLQQAYKDSRESGRHFDLHPWHKVPIPRYDNRNPLHKEISALCREAEISAERTVDQELKTRPNKGQIGLSKAVRKALADGCARRRHQRVRNPPAARAGAMKN